MIARTCPFVVSGPVLVISFFSLRSASRWVFNSVQCSESQRNALPDPHGIPVIIRSDMLPVTHQSVPVHPSFKL